MHREIVRNQSQSRILIHRPAHIRQSLRSSSVSFTLSGSEFEGESGGAQVKSGECGEKACKVVEDMSERAEEEGGHVEKLAPRAWRLHMYEWRILGSFPRSLGIT